jgi:hypothetical protein
LQGGGPGFKSRWVHPYFYINKIVFFRAAGILDEYLVKGYIEIFNDFMIIRVYVTLLALTN